MPGTRTRSGRTHLLAQCGHVLNVQLIESLDVVRCERDRHQEEITATSLAQVLDGVAGLW